jgi:hypothetical protein
MAFTLASPTAAIVDGVPDGGEHPYVGELMFYQPDFPDPRFSDPGSWANCTGSLITPTIVLTAGHCTYEIGKNGTSSLDGPGEDGSGGNDVWITFAEAADFTGISSDPFIPGDDNAGRYASWSSILERNRTWIRGTAYPHPQFDPIDFARYDVGVVILDKAVRLPTYGKLPSLRFLDQFRGKEKSALFEIAGYGLTDSGPKTIEFDDTRDKAVVKIVNFDGVHGLGPDIAIIFSRNNSSKLQGGACFGDSGGAFLVNDTNQIVAVDSFGFSINCSGTTGGYRIDQPDDIAWLDAVLAGHPR